MDEEKIVRVLLAWENYTRLLDVVLRAMQGPHQNDENRLRARNELALAVKDCLGALLQQNDAVHKEPSTADLVRAVNAFYEEIEEIE